MERRSSLDVPRYDYRIVDSETSTNPDASNQNDRGSVMRSFNASNVASLYLDGFPFVRHDSIHDSKIEL